MTGLAFVRPILVLGMHRSGTSAISGMLAVLGLDTGASEGLVGSSESNKYGHYCQFTPDSFTRIIDQLCELQLISCKVDRMYATCKWGNEFYAVLSFPEVFSD